jgi:accessory gene regulator protein AgrB
MCEYLFAYIISIHFCPKLFALYEPCEKSLKCTHIFRFFFVMVAYIEDHNIQRAKLVWLKYTVFKSNFLGIEKTTPRVVEQQQYLGDCGQKNSMRQAKIKIFARITISK